jgi:putative ABC transport system permease protein
MPEWKPEILRRLAPLKLAPTREAEIADELAQHLEDRHQELLAIGQSEDAAYHTSLDELKSDDFLARSLRRVEKDLYREPIAPGKDSSNLFSGILQDIRYALRMLRKSPGFTAVAVLTLALGIGANTAIFSVVNSVLLKPLPYPEANRLAMIFLRWPSEGIFQGAMGNADFMALRQQQHSFSAVAAFSSPDNGFTLTGAGEATKIPGTAVTSDFFSVLGEKPILGRAFLPKESDPDQPKTVVVSYPFWKQQLGADSAAIGRTIALDEENYIVIGVMPPGFHFGDFARDQLWPILQVFDIHQRPPYNKMVIGRLKPGTSMSAASADATRIAAEVRHQYPLSGQNDVLAVPMKDFWVGKAAPALLTLLGAVVLVLLIAVVNVANLQIARATVRQREMAIRSALGAGWPRLARQLLTESILLGAIGAAFGLWLAHYGLTAILALSPQILPRMNEVAVDWRVLAFTAVVALVASVLFGLAPVLGLRSPHVDESLKQSDRSGTGSSRSRLTQNILVVSEFSLALILLAAAGLFLRSLLRTEAVSPGFQPAHIVATQINLPPVRYSKPEQVTSFYRQLLEKLDNTPGVEDAGLTLSAPPNLLEVENPFHLDGQSYEPGKSTYLAEEMPVSESYFRALGVPLIAGRFFDDQDHLPTRHVLIINRTMAQNYFRGRNAVGQRVQTGDADPKSDWYTIVGVVGDVKYEGLTQKDQPTMYVPIYDDGWNPWFTRSMFLLVRTRGDVGQIASLLRDDAASLDRDVPLSKIQTMDELLSQSVGSPRFGTVLVAIFAALALVLAAVGIYGVMSYAVARRTREIGIMLALGAQPADVLRLILAQGARLALLGAPIGLAAAFAVMRLFAGLLFGVSTTDPLTFVAVPLLLMLVALAACYIPARRAMKVDPMVALRYE